MTATYSFSTAVDGQMWITYSLHRSGVVELTVFTTDGRPIRRILCAHQTAGIHQVCWDGRDDHGRQVASGLYYYGLRVDRQLHMRKMLYLKKITHVPQVNVGG